MGFTWPAGIAEVPLLTRVDGNQAQFADGTTRCVDAIVLCTGYQHSFGFMADELRLRTPNVLYPDQLYKGVFWLDNPDLMYLGMQDQFYTFTMFDGQAWYARDYVLGRIALPSRADMAADVAHWRGRLAECAGAFDQIDFQGDYLADLYKDVDYPSYDVDLTRAHFKAWEHDKEASITGYRDRSFSSPCTGSVAPVHHTPWWQELDDSMTTFLGHPA
jgi:trimethylamine monooxygenase